MEAGTHWAETREAAQHLATHRMNPCNNDLALSVGAEGGDIFLGVTGVCLPLNTPINTVVRVHCVVSPSYRA